MTKRQGVGVVFLLLVPLLWGGCAPAMGPLVREKCQNDGCTKEQQYAAEAYAYRLKLAKENPDGTFSVRYAVLPNNEVARIVKNRLDDLDFVLDYNNPDWAPYIEEFGLRDELEQQKRIFKAGYGRLRLVDLHNDFKEYMGERSSYLLYNHGRGYDVSKVFAEDVFAAYPFTSDRIENARANGMLKEVERFVWSARRELGRKEPDPNDPDDKNKFVWHPDETGIEFISYKIMDTASPRDNSVDYVEGTRLAMKKNGLEKESKPALKLFVPSGGYGAVLVMDKDKEGEIGFLLPDFVEQVSRVTSAQGLVNDSILSRLFQRTEEEEKRFKPTKALPPIVVEIAPVGKNKVDVWEYNNNGWTVPFKYKNERADNYSVSIKLKGEDESGYDPTSPTKQIVYFRKMWNGNGSVYEQFYPQSPYDQANLVRVSVSDKRVVLVTNNGDEITGYVTPGANKFIKDNPYSIEYTESETRWLLMDEDNDGKYEKRRQVAR